MKKKQILKLAVNLTEIIVAVIKKEIADSQLEKENSRRIHANSGVNAFEKAQETN
jgi:hypothetical protein